MIRQLGRGSVPITAFICVADSMLFRKASTLRSSLKKEDKIYGNDQKDMTETKTHVQ